MKRETWAGGLSLVAIAAVLVILYKGQPEDDPAPVVVPPSSVEVAEAPGSVDPDDRRPATEDRRPTTAVDRPRSTVCPFAIEVTYLLVDPSTGSGQAIPYVFMPLEDLESQIRAWRACA